MNLDQEFEEQLYRVFALALGVPDAHGWTTGRDIVKHLREIRSAIPAAPEPDEATIKALTVRDRWSEGIDHNPQAEKLALLIGEFDYHHFGDHFCWKFGGDGDNGETLTYILDEIYDRGLLPPAGGS